MSPRYFLDYPMLELQPAIKVVTYNALAISGLRLLVAGVYRKSIAERLPAPLFSRLLPSHGIKGEKIRKLYENLYYAIWHTMSFILVCVTMLKEDWFWKYLQSWDAGHTSYDFPHPVTDAVESVYLLELGFWISCLAFLSVETVRKDSLEMAIHHAATIALIGLSHAFGYNRIGLLVMAIHDIGDIFLYSAKFFNYLNFAVITNVLFGLFVVVFFLSRLVVFPSVILVAWGPVTGYVTAFDWRDHHGSLILPSLLLVLQALHVMWFVLILRMVMNMFRNEKKQVEGDIRSDDEGTSPEQITQSERSRKQD
jgi:hypothetical protein